MRIIGLDPGSRVAGYGVIDWDEKQRALNHIDHGVIRVPSKLDFGGRLAYLHEGLEKLFKTYRPQQASVEKIFLGKSAESAFVLGHARGVCMAQASRYGCEIFEYASRSVKKKVTGRGGASKEQVRLVVFGELLIRSDAPLDSSDALALAICQTRWLTEQAVTRQLEGGHDRIFKR